jgi:hypothetical protein
MSIATTPEKANRHPESEPFFFHGIDDTLSQIVGSLWSLQTQASASVNTGILSVTGKFNTDKANMHLCALQCFLTGLLTDENQRRNKNWGREMTKTEGNDTGRGRE